MPTRASDRVTLAVVASQTYVRTYYRLQASNLAAPAVPTTNPPPSPWTTTEPTYTAGATSTLYTVQLIAYGTATFEYGPVQVSSAFEAAKQAYNLANQANQGQAAVPRPLHGTAVPTTSSPSAPNFSVYYRHEGSIEGPMIASYTRWNGTWVETPLRIFAGQIVGGEVIGLLVATAAAGQRVVMRETRLDFYNEQDAYTGAIRGFDNGAAGLGIEIASSLLVGTRHLPRGGSVNAYAEHLGSEAMFTDQLRSYSLGIGHHTPYRGVAAERSAVFPTSTAAQRLALHNDQVQWYNDDTRCVEQYFATTADGATSGAGAVTTAGWYPISGLLPAARTFKAGGSTFMGTPNHSTVLFVNQVEWAVGGLTYNGSTDRFTIPVTGRYRVRFHTVFSFGGTSIEAVVRDTAGVTYVYDSSPGSGGAWIGLKGDVPRRIAAGTQLRYSIAPSGNINGICQPESFFVDIEYVSPPFA